jgi:hypothetical protein
MGSVRFGKLAPRRDPRDLRFAKYAALAPPPASVDNVTRVTQRLRVTPKTLWPMDGNDTYGDCTIAAAYHAVSTWRGFGGPRTIWSPALCEKVYFHLTGGADNGLVVGDVLDYWRSPGIGGDSLYAYASIDPKNHTHIKQAVQLFGGVYIGFVCQQNVITDFNAGRPWTPGTLTNEGHAVFIAGYDTTYVTCLTWGSTQKGTWAWLDACCDEAFACLPPEATDPAFAPGFNLAALQADLALVTN